MTPAKTQTAKFSASFHQGVLFACGCPRKMDPLIRSIELDRDVIRAETAQEVLEFSRGVRPQVALVDVDVPGMGIMDLLRRLRRLADGSKLLILLFGQESDLRLRAALTHRLADGTIALPCSSTAFLQRFWNAVDEWTGHPNLSPLQRALLKMGQRCFDSMDQAVRQGTPIDAEEIRECSRSLALAARADRLTGIMLALKAHHSFSFVHTLRVSMVMTVFGKILGMREEDLMRLAQTGLVHDIGKSTIPLEILDKPSALSPVEWQIMRGHPDASAEILCRNGSFAQEIVNCARNHHEKLDGTGYPRGLAGCQIDDLSLVCAVADIYCALTEKRSYKARMSNAAALSVMHAMAGPTLEPSYLARFAQAVEAGAFG
jgi:HD-GYP domain-containing protein (c-di-GMP phosphodiesterase class II)